MKLFILLGIAAMPLLASPASAANAGPQPAQRYLACVAQKHPAAVRDLLQAPTREAADRPYRSLKDDERCVGIVFRNEDYRLEDVAFPIDVMRGKLAEQSLLASGSQAAALTTLPLEQKRYIRPWFAATGRHPSVDEMGACMADTDPSNVLALLGTPQDSAAESQALSALSPSLDKCLSAGTRLESTLVALRAALAEALYQRMINPALSAAARTTPQ